MNDVGFTGLAKLVLVSIVGHFICLFNNGNSFGVVFFHTGNEVPE